MSCWRVLTLYEQPHDKHVPQLLVKPAFFPDSYIVHLTDLSNIWSEELSLDEIVDRASREQSPIEVSKQDTTQLAILLENVAKPLNNADDAICRMARSGEDGITLHASISLPDPLGRLSWTFQLQKRTTTVLKNELILPLLVSSHIQNERIASLTKIITSKDKAINRLLDQFDSSSLDLAAAFPGVGSIKGGRRMIKREQAAKHVPALQPFHETVWKQETGQLEDSELTSLGLFQEALAQNTPHVPEKLKSEDSEPSWWVSVPTHLAVLQSPAKKSALPLNPKDVSESSDEETEDEFDTHENFKTRNLSAKYTNVKTALRQISPSSGNNEDESDSTEDEIDLDAPSMSVNQTETQTQGSPEPSCQKPLSSEQISPPRVRVSSAKAAKVGSFRIGRRLRTASQSPPPSLRNADVAVGAKPDDVLMTRESVPPFSSQTDVFTTPKKSRKFFRIGGKGKAVEDGASQRATTTSPGKSRLRATQSPTVEPPSSPPLQRAARETTPVQEVIEETPEEKAERRRIELKRKNEEAAKKLAQQKKKKRF